MPKRVGTFLDILDKHCEKGKWRKKNWTGTMFSRAFPPRLHIRDNHLDPMAAERDLRELGWVPAASETTTSFPGSFRYFEK